MTKSQPDNDAGKSVPGAGVAGGMALTGRELSVLGQRRGAHVAGSRQGRDVR